MLYWHSGGESISWAECFIFIYFAGGVDVVVQLHPVFGCGYCSVVAVNRDQFWLGGGGVARARFLASTSSGVMMSVGASSHGRCATALGCGGYGRRAAGFLRGSGDGGLTASI